MKRKTLALTLILTLLLLVTGGVQLIFITAANPFPTNPVISIESPVNKTYEVNSLVLNVTIVTKYDGWYFTSARRVSYSLDGKATVPIPEIEYSFDQEEKASTFNGSAILSELTDGLHNLTVYVEYDYDIRIIESQSSTYFTIGTTPNSPPTTFVLASIASVAVVGLGLMFYLKRRRAKPGGEE